MRVAIPASSPPLRSGYGPSLATLAARLRLAIATIAGFALVCRIAHSNSDAPAPTEQSLSLESAIKLALDNNPEFTIIQQDVETARADVAFAEGAASPKLLADLHVAYEHLPGGATGIESKDRQLAGVLAIQGRLDTGLDYRLEWSSLIRDLDSVGTVYGPLHSTTFRLTLVQPLLRNAWLYVNDAPIVIAARKRDVSQALVRARAERLIADVEVAYWTLSLARQEQQILEGAVKVAAQQVEDSKKQVRVGSGTQVDVLEADAELKRSLEEIPASKEEIALAERVLLALVLPRGRSPKELLVRYVPTTVPEVHPLTGSAEELVSIGEERRADLQAAKLDFEAAEVAREVAENHLWPAIDLIGAVGVTGFSGTLSDSYGTAGFNTEVIHGGTGERLPPINADPTLDRGLANTYRNLRYPSGSIGLRVEIPFDNAQARAEHRKEVADATRKRLAVEDLRTRIGLEIVTAVRQLDSNLEAIGTTKETVDLAESLLDAQKRRFNAGVGVSFDVFRASAAVTRAKIAHLRARIRGRIAEARVVFAQGTYLESHGIVLSSDGAQNDQPGRK